MTTVVLGSFLRQYDCLEYAALMAQVALGLEHVIEEGELPTNYRGVFQKAVNFFSNIVRDGSKTPPDAQVSGVSDAAVWFSNLTQCYPEICRDFKTYDELSEIKELLSEIAEDDLRPIIYPVDRLMTLHDFFWALWDAVEQECCSEGIDIDIDFLVFPEASTLVH